MKTSHNEAIGVIGAGLGGLAAACTLAARGYKVVLFERNDWLGGKAARLEGSGFRFDMGPTIVTIPSVLRRVFNEAGRRMEDYLELVRLDPQWRCFFENGSVLNLHQDPRQMALELSDFAPGTKSGERYLEFIELSARLNDISQRYFFYKPIGGLRDMFDFRSSFDPKVLGDVLAMRMGGCVAGTVRSFMADARVAQMMDHFTQYVGSSPYGSPSVLCGIAHMQTDEGVWYPMGGTRAVPIALEKLARELGVEIRARTQITNVLTRDGEVTGVRTREGEEIPLRALVSNCDAVRTHRELINGAVGARFEKRRRYEPACSGVVLYLGLKKRYEHLAHHDFVFSADPKEEFDWIYKRGEPAPDPTCYLAATTCSEPATAPPGGEALYVLVHTPYLRPHHDWRRMLPEYRRVIIEKLKSTGQMPDIEERIVFERTLTPQDIHERYHVLNGAIYGLVAARRNTVQSHISRQIGELETGCGGALFRRTGRGVALTEFGAQVERRVRVWLRDSDALFADIRQTSQLPMGEVRLGILPSAAHPLMSHVFSRLHAEFPGIRLNVREGQGGELDQLLDTGSVDMAVLFRYGRPSGQEEVALATAATYLVSAPGNALTASETVEFRRLEGLPLVLPRRPAHWRALLDETARSKGFSLEAVIEADSLGLQKEVVAADARLYALLGPFSVEQELRTGRLQAARIVSPELKRHVTLALPRQGQITRASRIVSQVIQETTRAWGGQLSPPPG